MYIETLKKMTQDLSESCDELDFEPLLVFNPLSYAKDLHFAFLEKYIKQNPKALLLGMNPGPYGMMQNGIPFGSNNMVRSYLKIDGKVQKPAVCSPTFEIEGLSFPRQEVSGKRFWSFFQTIYENPEDFGRDFALLNYCPLGFIHKTKGTNVTPDKLSLEKRKALFSICDSFLTKAIALIKPSVLIGIGGFTCLRLEKLDSGLKVFKMEHPSPLNRNIKNGQWSDLALRDLKRAGVL